MSLCFFFHKRGSKASNTFLKVHPPPPPPYLLPPQSPSNSVKDTCTVFWPSKIEILRCLEMNREGGGGGGVEFDTILSICFCILEKKNTGTFFSTKRAIRSNLENRYEIVIWGRLARSHSIDMAYCIISFLFYCIVKTYSIEGCEQHCKNTRWKSDWSQSHGTTNPVCELDLVDWTVLDIVSSVHLSLAAL